MCREYTAVKISACTTRRRPVALSNSHAHPGEVDLAFHARFAVDHRHRPTAAATLILGVFLAVAVQRPLRDDHALAGQQVADLDHRQALVDPFVDLIVVGTQHFPR
jgi:hypothetical protein